MPSSYVHGYDPRENTRLQDQASTPGRAAAHHPNV